MVTLVFPVVGPEVGEIAVTVGWSAVVTPVVGPDVGGVAVTAEPDGAESFAP
jgi:hypothetical protein